MTFDVTNCLLCAFQKLLILLIFYGLQNVLVCYFGSAILFINAMLI